MFKFLTQLISVVIIISATLFLVGLPIFAQPQFTSTKDLINLGQINSNLIRAYKNIKITDAWQFVENANLTLQVVKIGIIDSGVDINHPEFQSINLGHTPPDARFDHDTTGHGTQITGIIGANNISSSSPSNYIPPQMNGIVSGVNGLNYIIEHLYDGGPSLFKVLSNIPKLAVLRDVDIINISSSFSYPDCNIIQTNTLEAIFFTAISAHFGTLFIPATAEIISTISDAECFLPGALGNNLDNVINVGGLDITGENRWPNSSFGEAVNISAPAINVYAPRPPFISESEGQYDEFFSGTSASAPMVTGVAGLIKAIKPELTPPQIKNILVNTADPISTDKPIGGRLNALKAVQAVLGPGLNWQTCGQCPDAPEISIQNNTLILGETNDIENGFQNMSVHGASALLPPASSYTITFNFDLSSWDSYNAIGTPNPSYNGGTGYWDSFSISVSPQPYWNLNLADPITINNLPGLGFIWGPTSYGDGFLESTSGTQTIIIPGNPNAPNYLNVVLDTATQPFANHAYPSWGTITIIDID